MIRTVQITKSSFNSLECFQDFQETMSLDDWQIERVDFVYFLNKMYCFYFEID